MHMSIINGFQVSDNQFQNLSRFPALIPSIYLSVDLRPPYTRQHVAGNKIVVCVLNIEVNKQQHLLTTAFFDQQSLG